MTPIYRRIIFAICSAALLFWMFGAIDTRRSRLSHLTPTIGRFQPNPQQTDLILHASPDHELSSDNPVMEDISETIGNLKTLRERLEHVLPSVSQVDLERMLNVVIVVEFNPLENQKYLCAYSNVDKHDSYCYPKTMELHDNWQLVAWGQSVPRGSEVKMDLEKLTREARIRDGHQPIAKHAVNEKFYKIFVTKMHSLVQEFIEAKQIASVEWKEELDQLGTLLIDSKLGELFASNFNVLAEDDPNSHLGVPINSFEFMMYLTGHSDEDVVRHALIVIGNAFSNNGAAQKYINDLVVEMDPEDHPYAILLHRLRSSSQTIQSEILFALAQMTTGNKVMAGRLLKPISETMNGFDEVLEVMRGSDSIRVRSKAIRLVAECFQLFYEAEGLVTIDENHEPFWWDAKALKSTQNWCVALQTHIPESVDIVASKKGSSEHHWYISELGAVALRNLRLLSAHDKVDLCTFTPKFTAWLDKLKLDDADLSAAYSKLS